MGVRRKDHGSKKVENSRNHSRWQRVILLTLLSIWMAFPAISESFGSLSRPSSSENFKRKLSANNPERQKKKDSMKIMGSWHYYAFPRTIRFPTYCVCVPSKESVFSTSTAASSSAVATYFAFLPRPSCVELHSRMRSRPSSLGRN